MTNKIYNILLDNIKIGSSELEKADAPMGVVFGRINFINISSAYDFPEDKLISTRTINRLEVKNEEGVEIKGLGNQITGIDSDEFEITIEGVPYPFYEQEFPHHVKAYNNQFEE